MTASDENPRAPLQDVPGELPPKLQGGGWYAFAKSREALTIFRRRGGESCCRQITEADTSRVCEASGLPKKYRC